MKVLFVATVRSHVGQFHMPFIRELKARGVEVDAAFKDNSADKPGLDLSAIDKTFEVPFERQPLRPDNLKAYRSVLRSPPNPRGSRTTQAQRKRVILR